MTLLVISTVAVPVLGVAAWLQERRRRKQHRHMPTTEWCEALRQVLAEDEPIARPRFLSRFTATGAEGICRPERKRREIAVVRKRAGK
jgi:hypothetical protein